ncbi:MAG: hypothetical protein HQM14_18165 [SAR324 cluster bacterium]|nr:hypothetical protein [SAR324 cluster bacterium]
MHKLPNTENLKISSLEDASSIIKLLILKVNEMEKREPIRDQGLVEEIIHLRTEMNTRFIDLEGKVDENTLAVKSLEIKFDQMHETMKGQGEQMKGGFDNIGKILQEISNKLDK